MASPYEVYLKLVNLKPECQPTIEEVSELSISCKCIVRQFLSNTAELNTSCAIKIQAVIDFMYERVNIGNWKEVKPYIRKTITIASYLRLLAIIKSMNELTTESFKEAYKIIDFGIMFGSPIQSKPRLLQNCASIINSTWSYIVDTDVSLSSQLEKNQTHQGNNAKCETNYNIEVIDCPSMEHFYKHYILVRKPVVLDNCINHWPALTKWTDQNYFLKLAGLRTVSIEIGNKYTDSDWTQKLITIEDFIKRHIYQTDGPTGYLAQYQLFDQIPELKMDIIEPEYCCFSDSNEPVDVNAWYGPKGTVSPLHYDPKRNLLAQVIGEKQLFLFAPEDSEYLYPHEHELLNNTAQIDPRVPDLEKYPNYKHAKPYYCVLRPGQMLYIPPKWWHFVESLSISFSVSFWWE